MAGIIEVKDQGVLRIYDADNSNYVDIVVPSTVSSNRTITIPDASFTIPTSGGVAGITSNADATAITIDSSERVGIGATSPGGDFEVKMASNVRLVVDDTLSSGVTLRSIQDSGNHNHMSVAADNIRFLTQTGSNTATEKLRILSGGGITFNGDTADANALSDYEEGTWSPAISGSTITTGYYTKVGRICIAQFGDATTNVPELTNGSNFTITGLPFSQLGSGWTYGSTPSVSYADASSSYHSFPLTGRQRNDGAIHVVNRSGQTKVASDPVNLCIVYQTT